MSTLYQEIISQDLTREERLLRAEERTLNKEKNKDAEGDLRIDLTDYIRQSKSSKERAKYRKVTHLLAYKNLKPQDVLLMQVPNINESGYYAGVVSLRSYFKKFNPEISVKIIDPVIDYFAESPPDKESEFFRLFNTYTEQGNYELLFKYKEINDIVDNYISKYIEKGKPKFVGFSIIDGNVDATLAICKLVKEKWPEIKLIIGGNGVQLLNWGYAPIGGYQYDDYDFVDYIVRGDGEVTLTELVLSDQIPKTLKNIKGLIWRNEHNKIVDNIPRENIELDILPYPDYSDLMDNYYYKQSYGGAVPINFSRGCPYRCTFCSVPTFVPVFRYRPLDTVLEELESWIKQDKRAFFCHDSIVNGDPEWVERLCNAIIDKGWASDQPYSDTSGNITWGGNFRLQSPMRNLETLKLYNNAGVDRMIIGLESASEPVLKHMKKYGSIKGTREIFENIREVNKTSKRPIKIMLQLIIGYLNEGEEDFQKTMDFVEEFHDVIHEVLTCSAFLLWGPLEESWKKEGKYLESKNTVEWETEYNTVDDRLDRLDRIEKLFKKLDITYNIYHRGVYKQEMAKNI